VRIFARLVIAAVAVPVLAVAASAPVALKTTEFGKGPTIVMVHALGAGRMGWMPVARKLLPNYRVVMVDLPGHGDTPMPESFSFEGAAEALDQVLARQNAESTIVVGYGTGGMLAVLAVHAHPEHARGAVAIDAWLKFPMEIADQEKKQFLAYMDEHFDDFLKRMFTGQGRDSAQGVTIHALASLVPRENMKVYFARLLDADASGAVKNFPRPLLYIGSEKGWPAGKDWAAIAHEHGWEQASGVQTMRIGASGAMIATDQPDSLSMAISNFAKQAFAAKK